MFNQHNKIKVISIIILILFTLTGCVFSSVTSRSGHVASQKLSEVSVKWSANTKLKYQIGKQGRGSTKEKADKNAQIKTTEKKYAYNILKGLINEFRTSTPTMIENKLLAHGVIKGNYELLELTPIEVYKTVGGGKSIHCKITLTNTSSSIKLWSVVIKVNGSSSTSDEKFSEEFVNAVYKELLASGWI